MKGKVYLTGAGPGDIDLITVKAKKAIEEADVILYDRLANDRLLDYASADSELYYVGKKAKKHYYTQTEINELLIEKASEGKIVTRLKGGDSFVFGRGGEEALVLEKADIDFEIIPGITSPVAVPEYAGIPVTQRNISSSFAVITGHEASDKKESAVDWSKLADSVDTLIVLMGVGNLPNITKKLMEAGMDKNTPVALIRWGTRSSQETISGELFNIAEKVKVADFKPPAVIVIGKVVNLRKKLNWFEKRPLFSENIIVTRPKKQAGKFSSLLEKQGAEAVSCPTIEITPPDNYQGLDTSIKNIDKYDWIIFTSVNGVKYFLQRLFQKGLDIRSLAELKIGAIGSKTAQRLQESGIIVDFRPENYSTEGILEEISDFEIKNDYFLLPRADIAPPRLKNGLEDMGAEVDDINAYCNIQPDFPEEVYEKIKNDEIDMVTFTSSSTVQNFVKSLQEYDYSNYKDIISNLEAACIGPVTADTAREEGFSVEVVAAEYTIEKLADEIIDYYNKKREG